MAIKKETKKRILLLVEAGIPVAEVALDEGVNKGTIHAWMRKQKAEGTSPVETIENIKKQLSILSKRKATDAVSRKIAMLSKSLSRLERREDKKQITALKAKPVITDISTHKDASELKAKALAGEYGDLYQYQKNFLQCNDQFRVVLKSRQIGFSFVAALDALIAAVAGRSQFFIAASEDQALILMGYIDYWNTKIGVDFVTDGTKEKKLGNGAIIKAMANNYKTIQGRTGDIWMDEFAWYDNPKRIWKAIVPSIGAVGGRLTVMSTPFEEPSFYHDLIHNTDKYHMFTRFRIDIYQAMEDGLVFDLETMRDLFDADSWASGYECQFVDDESSLFSISLIKECVDNRLSYFTPSSKRTIFSGYDIGRTAHRSALAALVLQSTNIYDLAFMDILAKASFDEQRLHLKRFMDTYPLSQMAIDRTGIGMDIAETMVKTYRQRVKGVHFTASQKESMALNLKKLFEDKLIRIPNDPLLIADIHSIKRKAGARGFLYDSKQNEHGHADRFWALALAASHIEAIVRKQGRKGRGLCIR